MNIRADDRERVYFALHAKANFIETGDPAVEALRRAVDLLDDLELGLSEHQASTVEQIRSALTDSKP